MQNTDRMNDEKKLIIWRHWQDGSPMSLIARAVQKPPFPASTGREKGPDLLPVQ